MKLYDLTAQYAYLNELIDNGELSAQDLEDTLASIEGAIEIKMENIIKVIKNMQAEAKALKEEEDRLATRRRQLEARELRLKQYAQQQMEVARLDKLNAGIFKVRLQKNPTSVDVFDEAKVPDRFKEPQAPKVLKKEILEELKNGAVVEGAQLAPEKKHIRFQ